MVRSIHKINIFSIPVAVITLVGMFMVSAKEASATDPSVTFNVNIAEILTVSVDKPTTWASGTMNELLRNKISVSAKTNNYYGVTLSMYADALTLNNTKTYDSTKPATYIETLNDNYSKNNFPTDAWGYSIDDTDAGNNNATYSPIVTQANAVTLISRTPDDMGTVYSKNVFFGAKATNAKNAGTYAQTVNFVAVTGVIDTETNPPVPDNPSTDNPQNEIASYNSTRNTTTYTGRTTNTTTNTTTTTTQVTNGNTVSTYANPAGVTTSSNGATALATGLAVAAGVTATSGTLFFILAKRRDDDDDEEEEE